MSTKPLGVWVSAELLGELVAGNQLMLHHLCSLTEAQEAGAELRTTWHKPEVTIKRLQRVVKEAQHRQYVMREADRRRRLRCCDAGEDASHESCCVVDAECTHPANGPRTECPPCVCVECERPVCYACSLIAVDRFRKGKRSRVCRDCVEQDGASGRVLRKAHEHAQAGYVDHALGYLNGVSKWGRYTGSIDGLTRKAPESAGPVSGLLLISPRNKAVKGDAYVRRCKVKEQNGTGSYCEAGHEHCAAWDLGPCYRRLTSQQEDWERFGISGLNDHLGGHNGT